MTRRRKKSSKSPRPSEKEIRYKTIKELALEGNCGNRIATIMGLPPTTVRGILGNLVAKGELVRVPNSSPALYTDPRARVSLTEAGKSESAHNEPIVKNNVPLFDALPDSGRLPLGFVNRHLSGFIAFKVRVRGTFDEVIEPGSGPCGKWSEPASGGKGQTRWNCILDLFGQTLTVSFYESTHGTLQFRLFPGRVYLDPTRVSLKKAEDYMMQRAHYVASLMRATGWQVTDPVVKGVWHTAKENDPLARLIPSDRNDESDDIIVDKSPGVPETEMEDDSDEELVRIYANMPSAIKAVGEAAAGASAKADSMLSEVVSLRQVVVAQSEVIAMLMGNVTALAEVQAKFATMSASQVQCQIRDAFSSFDGRGYV